MSERASLRAAFAALPAPLQGALWMIAASAGFAAMNGAIRHISTEIHPFEIAFFRNFFGFLFMLPWLMSAGLGALKTDRLGLYTLRGAFGIAAMMAWFWSLSVMPLAEAVALNFTLPLFATILAAVILREVVRVRRWTAIFIGFVGAMVILRPGAQEIGLPQLMVLFAALMMAATAITVKVLARTESPVAIVMYMTIFLTPLSAIPAVFVWEWPDWNSLVWLASIGLIANFSHLCITHAFKVADASAVMPFDFARLVFVAIIGYVFFDEFADTWTWVGAGIIAVSAVYIAHRETRVALTEAAAAEAAARGEGQ